MFHCVCYLQISIILLSMFCTSIVYILLKYKECLSIRRHTNLPFILDENIHDVATLLRAHNDGAADLVNIKISKLGGLTKAKQVRWGYDNAQRAIDVGSTSKFSLNQRSNLISTLFIHYFNVRCPLGGFVSFIFS